MNLSISSGGRVSVAPMAVWLLYFSAMLHAAPEFAGYLLKALKNHTAQACDGEQITVTCPFKTSISILSAFYGRKVSSENLCPDPTKSSEESTDCMSPTAIQKVEDECQDKRSCQFSINSRLFGLDPCPGTHKYLLISYKCKPDNHKIKAVCENKKLRLQCNKKMVLAIYSASYGRWHHGELQCPPGNSTQPDIECLSQLALRKVSRKCHNKQNCTLFADKAIFGDPCYPGVNKQLSVSYICVPKQLLEEASQGQGPPDPFSLSDYTHGLPEKVGLYFVCGVCAGLVFLLYVFGSKIPIKHDIIKLFAEDESGRDTDHGSGKLKEDDDDDDSSSDSSFRHLTRTYHVSENIFSPDVAAKMAARVEQREQDGEDIWLQQESSPYSIHKVKSATK